MVHKLVYVFSSLVLGLLAFTFGIVGISTNEWRTGGLTGAGTIPQTLGLWKICQPDSCSDLLIGQNRAFFAYEIVRGFGILAVITAFAGVVVAVLSAVPQKINIGPSVLATFFLMSAGFGIICASVFTSLNHATTNGWGYSFALTWLAVPLSLIAGAISVASALRHDD